MRLLTADANGNFSLTTLLRSNIPPYAVLSHVWGSEQDEITFEDIHTGQYKNKAGFAKLKFCLQQTAKDEIEHFWIDTCCIKKSDSAELSEAITSMFRIYRDAQKCLVYLSDVPDLKRNNEGSMRQTEEQAIYNSRWFTRGWTLQELVAPSCVEFYSREHKYLGSKKGLATLIHRRTDIPIPVLLVGEGLSKVGIQERISWVRERHTQRLEDKTYCLLGILGVSMPCNYGEGEDALQRLTDVLLRKYPSHEVCGLESFYNGRPAGTCDRTSGIAGAADFALQAIKKALDSLFFEQMDVRRSTIKRQSSSTCSWLLKHKMYLDWKDPAKFSQHHGLLWIKGKPGSGKSTLMKFAHATAAKECLPDETVVSFFFNARGYELEKTTVGMYRALLFQLFDGARDLREILLECQECRSTDAGCRHIDDWRVERLCDKMTAVVKRLGRHRLTCFIDALDEGDEHQVREMIYFFEDLGRTALEYEVHLRICFASRHYPTIAISYGLDMTVEDEQGHSDDLAKYINSHLRAGRGNDIEDFKARVMEKANGVFLWTVLVVDILNEEFLRGYRPAVESRLNKIPSGLHELFRNTLRRDRNHMADFRLCLQWILFAERPLTREEFYFAMMAGLDSSSISDWDADKIDVEYMERYVRSSSKGLAELTRSSKPTVQFIHESVRDFLEESGVTEVWPEHITQPDRFESECHDKLKRCCETQLAVDLSRLKFSADLLPPAAPPAKDTLRETVIHRHPFLEYATQNVFHHANEAAKSIDQYQFLKHFGLGRWDCMAKLFHSNHVFFAPCANILHVLADRNYPRLIRMSNTLDAFANASPQRYKHAFFAALKKGHIDCIRALFQHRDASLFEAAMATLDSNGIVAVPGDPTPLTWGIRVGNRTFARMLITSNHFQHPTEDAQNGSPLQAAAEKGYVDIIQLLLEKGANVNEQGGKWCNALQAASSVGSVDIVQLLLDNGANINERGGSYGSALQTAALSRDLPIVWLLLDRGADINAQGGAYGTALQAASWRGVGDIVQVLIHQGADVNAQGGLYHGALQAAAASSYTRVVQLLLGSGANVNAQGGYFGDALQIASAEGYAQTVELLLDGGAHVNTQGGRYGSALQAALVGEHAQVVRLLRDRGA